MFVCVCSGVTDSQIKAAIDQGASSLDDLRQSLNIAANCGQCALEATALLQAATAFDCSLAYAAA